jgi:hypothetical protein
MRKRSSLQARVLSVNADGGIGGQVLRSGVFQRGGSSWYTALIIDSLHLISFNLILALGYARVESGYLQMRACRPGLAD